VEQPDARLRFVAALRDGALYVNAHTTTYPGGEVRGQIGARD
jgi:hypothetical protein